MMRVRCWLLTRLFLLAAVGCAAGEGANGASNPTGSDDEAQIYAAAIREIHTNERSSRLVYVISATEDLAYGDGAKAASQEISADLQEAIAAELADERFELIWIETFDDAPVGPSNPDSAAGWHIAEGEGIVISLGNIHPQEDDSVLLSFFMTCADVCGAGKTYVLEQYYNNWHVSGSVGPEIAS